MVEAPAGARNQICERAMGSISAYSAFLSSSTSTYCSTVLSFFCVCLVSSPIWTPSIFFPFTRQLRVEKGGRIERWMYGFFETRPTEGAHVCVRYLFRVNFTHSSSLRLYIILSISTRLERSATWKNFSQKLPNFE